MTGSRLSDLVAAIDDVDPRVALAATADGIGELERLQNLLVRRARVQGITWAEIALALGVSKQAVHKKFGGRRLFGSDD